MWLTLSFWEMNNYGSVLKPDNYQYPILVLNYSMRQATCLLLSLLIFCQYGICGSVPAGLRDIYGNTDPCEDPVLKYTMDEIRKLDVREFNLYKIQNEKCENYKKALIELGTMQNTANSSQQISNMIYWIGCIILVIWTFEDIF